MAQLIVIYTGESSRENLRYGIQNGIWGFKATISDLLKQNFSYNDESYVLLANGFSGGSPRKDQVEWEKHILSKIYLAKITEGIFSGDNTEWPDEKQINQVIYPIRFRFDSLTIREYKDIPIKALKQTAPNSHSGVEVSEMLRNSAINQCRGYLHKNMDISRLLETLENYEIGKQSGKINPAPINPPKNSMTAKDIILHVDEYVKSLGFRYSYEEISNFYLALKTKPFVILAGISGTGKTQLPRLFAEAIGLKKQQVIQVPVRPDWTDGSDLLGYTGLDNIFKPKELIITIKMACENPNRPYFFILDEMNLARVEHYFSDFLSIIETRRWEGGRIITDPMLRKESLQNTNNKSDYTGVGWPENLYLIGTVNMDETTHAFSRKVLDRANTIEMNNIDLHWVENAGSNLKPLTGIDNDFLKTIYLRSSELDIAKRKILTEDIEFIICINAILEKADLHFAYRVRDEIAFYLLINQEFCLLSNSEARDFQLVQKILPRVHGSSDRVQRVLIELLNFLEGKQFRIDGFEYTQIYDSIDDNSFTYPNASKKILFMLKRFEDDRFTSFWV